MMRKSHFKKALILISLIVISAGNVYSQMHCLSILGSHLTPVHEDVPLLWTIEGTMAPGVMSGTGSLGNSRINGGMVIGGLIYSFSTSHSVYAEGGFKNWKNSESVRGKL